MNDDLLIFGYLDGRLSPQEMAALNQRLRTDPTLREHLLSVAEQAVALGDIGRMGRTNTPTSTLSVSPRPAKAIRMPWFALAACLALLGVSSWLFITARPAPVLTLVKSTGTVAWTHGAEIHPGDKLPAGTLATVGETSTAEFEFADGSLITLHGEAELAFSDAGQKVLSLARGTLTAKVQPQPPQRPMMVRTPSAMAEVVGTVFDLTAREEDTLLKVDEGLVKLKRLADGSEISVPANQTAVASLNTGSKLDAAATPEPLTQWSFDFRADTPPRDWRGYAADGKMNATAYVARRLPDGQVITHYGVSVRTAMLPRPLRLLATPHSSIRYRLRQEQPGDLQIMLLTNRLQGNHGGNFECKVPATELKPDAEGWCDLTLPIDRFEPVDPRPDMRQRHPTAAGNILTSVVISTFREDRRLAVARFELHSRP
jgi:hypothetical protein